MNAARCKGCGEVLISLHVHDFQQCQCGNYIDGGDAYSRYGVVRSGDLQILQTEHIQYLLRIWGRSDLVSRSARGASIFTTGELDARCGK